MLTLKSPAKINLFLKIVGKREDGYHNIATLMHAINLYDTLNFSLADEDKLTANIPNIPLDHTNLILKAANIFREKTGLKFGLHIDLDKQIPIEAGLGGGSGNAATALWALNQLHHHPVDISTLMQWGAEIGSDIPFFLSNGMAYCTGRGELVQPIESLSLRSPLWIIKPSYGLSAKNVYQNIQYAALSSTNPNRAIEECRAGNFREGSFNDLEYSAFCLEDSLKQVKDAISKQGASHVLLSGSGTSFFAFANQKPSISNAVTYRVKLITRPSNSWY